jgi:hypothetical protein
MKYEFIFGSEGKKLILSCENSLEREMFSELFSGEIKVDTPSNTQDIVITKKPTNGKEKEEKL